MTACEGSRCGLCPGWGGQSTGTPQPPPVSPVCTTARARLPLLSSVCAGPPFHSQQSWPFTSTYCVLGTGLVVTRLILPLI